MDSAYSMSPELHHLPLLQLNGCNPPPMRRGPMYSAYAELRELNLRRRRAVSSSPVFDSSTTSASALSRSVADLSLSLRKENKKPPPPPPLSQRSEAWAASPPPMTPSAEARRARGKSVTPPPSYSQGPEMAATPRHPMTPRAGHNRGAEEKRGGGVSSLTKSYSCHYELKEFNAAAASSIDKEGKGLSKGGVLSRSVGGYRRQTAYMC